MLQENKQEKLVEYNHHMLKEIFEIPDSVNRLLNKFSAIEKLFECIPIAVLKKIKKVDFIGAGTAHNAGLVGKHLFETIANLQAGCTVASEFFYSNKKIDKKTLYIFVSQSGETTDTIECIKKVKAGGGKTLAIVNEPNSTLTKLSNFVLLTESKKELAVASTKAYVGQIAVMYLLAFAIFETKNKTKDKNHFDTNVSTIKKIFKNKQFFADTQNQIKQISKKYVDVNKIYLLGRHLDYLVAVEGALKLKETTYIPCHALPAGELRHGPISLIDKNTLAICINTQTYLAEKNLPVIEDANKHSGRTFAIVTNKSFGKKAKDIVVLPRFDDVYMPLLSIIPLQFFSYYLSLNLGNNPDKPRNLTKVVF